MEVFIFKQFLSVYQAKWMMDPFPLKFYYILIHYNIGENIDNGLNFVMCEQGLKSSHGQL